MAKTKIDYTTTPRRNLLERIGQQTHKSADDIAAAMNNSQSNFMFGETNVHSTPNPEPLPNPPEIERRVQELSAQILAANNCEKIATDAITTTPCYIGEEDETCKKLIETLSNQKGDFTSIIYLNGPCRKFSKEEYQKKLKQLKEYAKNDKRIIIIGHLYEENELQKVYNGASKTWADKVKIWNIRADMIDAVDRSIDKAKISDPKLIGLDADTFKLDDNYIMGMAEKLNTVNGFLTANRRRYDAETAKGDERALILERMYAAARKSEIRDRDWYWNGFLSGGTYGVKLTDYKKAGWFNRETDLCEDDELWRALISHGVNGIQFNRKVYSSPRRGQAAVNDGRDRMGQRSSDRKPIGSFEPDKASQSYKNLTAISGKLLNGSTITASEQKTFEDAINKVYHYTLWDHNYQYDPATWRKVDRGGLKQDMDKDSLFIRWRNHNQKGKYKIHAQNDGSFKLIEKTS